MRIYFKYFFQPKYLALLVFMGSNINAQLCRDSSTTITISAVGDLMCHSAQFQFAQTSLDTFNFNPVYRVIKNYLSASDFTFGNLETVVAGKNKNFSGYPLFNTPNEYVTALKNAGFNLLTTANNHSLDRGQPGVLRTIKILNKNKINYNGTFVSQADRDSIRIFDIKGIRVAFLAYSYGTNGNIIPKSNTYLINIIDFNLIRKDIREARKKNADIVLVHYHFGTEYQREPDNYQKSVIDSTIKIGADIIIGGHTHVIQPMKMFATNNSSLDSGLVAYSLGNFFSNQRWRYSDCGVILNISITKNCESGKAYISKIDYVPTWTFKGKVGGKPEYVIIPAQYFMLDDIYASLTESDFQKMLQAFQDTKFIIEKNFIKLPYVRHSYIK